MSDQTEEPKRYRYIITLKSTGESHHTRDKQTEEELRRWLATGAAGLLYSAGSMVRFLPDDIASIQPIRE